MTVTEPTTGSATTLESHRRPAIAFVALVLAAFLGVTALGGGIAMTFGLGGDVALPSEWLDEIPIVESWLFPGVVLGVGFGIGSLVVFWGLLRRPRWQRLGWIERRTRHHWSWIGLVLLGAGHTLWIALELLILPDPSWLQVVYGPIGLALLALPFTRSMTRYLASI